MTVSSSTPYGNPFLDNICTVRQLDALRASGNSGSPFRGGVVGADDSSDVIAEESHGSKKEKKPPGMARYGVSFP